MKDIVLTFLVLLLINCAIAQDQHVIDSVTRLIKNDGSREDMEVFHELAFQYIHADSDLALKYIDQALTIVETIADSSRLVVLSRLKGQILRRSGKSFEAVVLLTNILPIAERQNLKEVKYILNALAIASTHLGRFDRALEWNLRALELSRKSNDSSGIETAFLNIGFVHFAIGNNDKAVHYFERSLNISERTFNQYVTALNHINIGSALVSKGLYREGKGKIEHGLSICKEHCASGLILPALYGLATSDLHLGHEDRAYRHIQAAYRIAVINNDQKFVTECLTLTAQIQLKQLKFDSAELALKRAEEVAIQGNLLSSLALTYDVFSKLHRAKKDADSAMHYLQKYLNLHDSLLSEQIRNTMVVAETEYNARENVLKIEHRDKMLRDQKLQNQFVILICILVSLLAMALLLLLHQKQTANAKLDERVRERTLELEANKTKLERAFLEHNAKLNRASQCIKSALATQKGLNRSIYNNGKLGEPDLLIAKNIEIELHLLAEEISKAKNAATNLDCGIPSSNGNS